MFSLYLRPIGRLVKINRYPVKSFGGEILDRALLNHAGIAGDRSYAFIDPSKEGWSRYITARQYPQMLLYKARLVEDNLSGDQQLEVISPQGQTYTWDEQLLLHMQQLGHQNMTMARFGVTEKEFAAVDEGQLLMMTTHMLDKLKGLYGKEIAAERFRANLILELDEDEALDDVSFIGKQLYIGGTELYVNALCERCSMITIDPLTLERDAALLKTINETMQLKFGLYASVAKAGTLQNEDIVYIKEA